MGRDIKVKWGVVACGKDLRQTRQAIRNLDIRIKFKMWDKNQQAKARMLISDLSVRKQDFIVYPMLNTGEAKKARNSN